MTSKETIKNRIEDIVTNYSSWTIGVTDDPARRKKEHNYPSNWHYWDADSENDAREIETYFLNKGMNGGSGGKGDADWVYIFK